MDETRLEAVAGQAKSIVAAPPRKLPSYTPSFLALMASAVALNMVAYNLPEYFPYADTDRIFAAQIVAIVAGLVCLALGAGFGNRSPR